MTVFGGFDRIRIINLPTRTDRRREMTAELERLGVARDPRIQFVDGILVTDQAPFRAPGEKGVFLAHLKILKEAAAAEENVLILEDDVDFAAGAADWNGVIDCDIAYGGYEASNPADLQQSDIIGAHCMGFSPRATKALVPFLERLLSRESPPPIDGAYVWFRRQNPDFVTKFANPTIAAQRPSRSDIAKLRLFDRLRVLRGPISLARSAKRKLNRSAMTFGLPEAFILAAVGIAVACVAAYHFLH